MKLAHDLFGPLQHLREALKTGDGLPAVLPYRKRLLDTVDAMLGMDEGLVAQLLEGAENGAMPFQPPLPSVGARPGGGIVNFARFRATQPKKRARKGKNSKTKSGKR